MTNSMTFLNFLKQKGFYKKNTLGTVVKPSMQEVYKILMSKFSGSLNDYYDVSYLENFWDRFSIEFEDEQGMTIPEFAKWKKRTYHYQESEERIPKRNLYKAVENLIKRSIEKTYNDSTKLSLMDDGVCIDKYGTKVFTLSGGLNGKGRWNEYLETLAQFTIDLIDKLKLTYGDDADVWLITLKNDCADDIFYPVFGFKVGEMFDETEAINWQPDEYTISYNGEY